MMKKILCAFLMIFVSGIANANIHIDGKVARKIVLEHIDQEHQVPALQEYNVQLKATGNFTMSAAGLYKVCTAAGWDIATPDGKTKCEDFVKALVAESDYYEACGKDSKVSGAVCVNDFAALTVNRQQAQGLAKLYARSKSDNNVQCKEKARIDTKTTYSANIHAMGMSQMTSTPYIQCASIDSNKFYEFRFNNIDGNTDSTNHKNFKTGICKIFGAKYVTKELRNYTFNVCEGINEENICDEIDNILIDANIGYVASWGALGSARLITGNAYDYCMLYEQIAKDKDGVLLYEKTAFGLDGRVFLKAGIQRKGSNEIKKQIRSYVENTMGKENVKSFVCEETYHTVKLQNRSGTDDMLRCTINNKTVEFFFDDLSESWNTYDKSGREAMNCIAWGGTFTGKKCIGLDQKMCYKVRDANAQSCPECKKIQWNDKAKVCELPASVSATNLKRGLTYSAIVGGAVASVVITIGTAGAGGVTAGTVIIMLVETAGAGIELGAQINIDNKADKFFVDSASCNSESCAKELVKKYLTELARIGRDLTDAEADATDKEMARLIGLIPTNSDWWIDYLKMDDGSSLLEKANDGGWTAAQVWRAIGIGMQFAGVASSITGWIKKKTGYLEKTLDRTSKILLDSAKTAEKNIVKVDKLDDVGKEWYKLWKEYAPKNQTFDQFKAMTNGNLDEMKEMSKSWIPRSKRSIINAQIDKQLEGAAADLRNRYATLDNLMKKYNIDALPDDPNELAKLYKEHPDLEQATKTWNYAQSEVKKLQDARIYYNNTSYSTYDPEFTRISKQYQQRIADINAQSEKAWQEYQKLHPQATIEEYRATDTFKQLVEQNRGVRREYQYTIAEKYHLENLGNVVQERADEFADIIANNPEVQSKMNDVSWSLLSDQERANVAQQILDEYATKTNTPRAVVGLDYNTSLGGYHSYMKNDVVFNPNAQLKNPDSMVDVMAHEHGHLIDELAPNESALGEQVSYWSRPLYSIKKEDGYRIALTEQSSYKIGPNVSHEATGTTNPYYGKEYDLENAKNAEWDLQQDNQYNKETFDETVEAHASEVALGVTSLGVAAGTTKSIIEKKNKKKDK